MVSLEDLIKDAEERGEYGYNYPDELTYPIKNKKLSKSKKEHKESNIMKARSDLKKKGSKYTVDTEMTIKDGLDGKTKRALKKSIEDEVKKKIKGFKKPAGFGIGKGNTCCKNNIVEPEREDAEEFFRLQNEAERRQDAMRARNNYNNIRTIESRNSSSNTLVPSYEKENSIRSVKTTKGRGIEKIELDYSSDDELKKKRGRPKKGKGMDFNDSSSDEDEIKTYGEMLKHLIAHIKDPKEPIDPKDYKQAVELIKKIKSKKGGTIKGRGDKEDLSRYKSVPKKIEGPISVEKPFTRDFGKMRERAKERNRVEINEAKQASEKLANKADLERQRLDLIKMRQEVSGLSSKAEKALDDMLNIDKTTITRPELQKKIKNLEEGMKDFYENKSDRMNIKPQLPDELLVEMYESGVAPDIPYHLIANVKRRIEEKEGELKPSGNGMKKRRGRPRKY